MQNRAFYNVTLKNFAMPWTNRDQTVFAPLNDYVATVIGMVRDDVPFDRVLSADILYVGSSGSGVPAYSPANNDHYAALETQGVEPQGPRWCATTQSSVERPAARGDRGRDDHARRRAGVLHRRHQPRDVPLHADEPPVPDMEQVHGHDAAAGPHPPGREPQPRRRQPPVPEQLHRLPQRHGPDGAGLRVLRLRRDRRAALVYTAGVVQPKYFNNKDTFPRGFSTPDDRWDNYWRKGRNSLLGWDASLPGNGQGAKSLGHELAHSDAFAGCQVEKVFRSVCFRDAERRAGPREGRRP